MASKSVLIVGDLHCGSMGGLTHPDWIVSQGRSQFFSQLQEEMWDLYVQSLKELGEVDVLIVNGDVIDGKGARSGGTELITSDLIEQTDMAVAAIDQINAKSVYFTYGTPYHTAPGGEDFDRIVADQFHASIHDELDLDVEGVLFNVRHKIGTSSSPYNRSQPVGRARLWDSLRAMRNEDRRADVYVRSHVHYFSFCGESDWIAFTLPALQSNMTKFGARECIGTTDWGMVKFKVQDGMYAGYDTRIYPLMSGRKRIVKAR